MRVRTLFTLLFLVLLLTAFFHQGLAQTAGKLAGTVTDETGEPLIFANILIDGTTMGAATDVEGHYIILNVRPGVYTLRFQFIGYTTKIVENVRVSGDQTKTLDVVLTKEVIKGEEVIVVAKKTLVEFNQTSSVSSVNKDDIKSLPVQNLNEIVNLQAGVVDGHFRGGRIGEVQYQIDGVTVNNPFNNASMLSIDKSIIEEVQVISGTFDAKYGQAMSGVVNAVLRTGSDRFEISGEAYLGDYYATDTKRYPRIDEINPLGIHNVQLSLSGPTGIPQTTFFLSGRAYWSDGWMSGIRRFTPFDSSDFEKRIFLPTGDDEVVPMNTMKDFSGQAKITNQSIRDFQIFYQATLNYSDAKSYNHSFRLNPDGTLNNYTTSLAHGLGITHTLSPVMFYKLNFRHNYFLYESYKYKELEDPRYLQAADPKGDANYEDGAIVQGVDLGRYRQSTSSFIAKSDFTWQLNRINMIEAGLEAQVSEIVFGPPGFFVSTTIDGVQVLKPVYQYPKQPGLQTYHPSQGAAYIQDRVELGDLVVRAGLRFEFFNANSRIPSDFQNPANAISGAPKSTLVETKVKYAVAPRLGFSFPLTTTASVYFSYGHFYQLPGLGLLYGNADYSILEDLQAGGISYGVMGNPDLKP
ncbi:partial Protein oar, partial [uncultured bacterium]